jgi:hypothetical protein
MVVVGESVVIDEKGVEEGGWWRKDGGDPAMGELICHLQSERLFVTPIYRTIKCSSKVQDCGDESVGKGRSGEVGEKRRCGPILETQERDARGLHFVLNKAGQRMILMKML